MHGIQSTQLFNPFEGFVHHENGEHRRSIKHGVIFGRFADVGSVIDHGLKFPVHFAEQILTHNNECNTGRTHIFLSATINQRVFAYINRARHDIRRHIGHQRNRAVDIFVNFRSVNGVVGGDVEIIGICGNGVTFWYVGVIFIFGRGNNFYFTVKFCFLDGFLCPYACLQISGFFA